MCTVRMQKLIEVEVLDTKGLGIDLEGFLEEENCDLGLNQQRKRR